MSVYDNLPQVYGTGEVLQDSRTDWKREKLRSIAVSYVMPTEKRSERMSECSTSLEFAADRQGNKRLYRANFCKDRMCPSCQRRRSLKVFHQIQGVCTGILKERPSTCFLMLTLTVPNVHKDKLSETLTHMFDSWGRLSRRSDFKKAIFGWFRSLEVTVEKKRADHYHPHFHILLAVPSGYFKKKIYISQPRWLELWQEATRQPEITQVDVRRVKPSKRKQSQGATELNEQGGSSQEAIASASAEVGKYATKPGDYLEEVEQNEFRADGETVEVLAEALRGRRIIAFGGAMKEQLAKLESEDLNEDSADLVRVGEESSDIDAVVVQIFRWHSNHKSYIG